MARGRPAKPIEQHKREGTTPTGGARPPVQLGGRERPDMPDDLDPESRKVWKLVVEDLHEGNVLDRADGWAIEQFSRAVGMARHYRKALEVQRLEARRAAKEEGGDPFAWLTQEGQKGALVPNVYVSQEREAWREARQVGENLGLSPSARARLGMNVKGAGRRQGQGKSAVPASAREGRGGLGVIDGGEN